MPVMPQPELGSMLAWSSTTSIGHRQALGYRTPAKVYQVDQEGWEVPTQETGLPSEVVVTSARAGDSFNLALGLFK